MKTALQSKTIKFQIILGFVDAVVGGFQMFAPFLDPMQFAVLFVMLSAIHKGGSTYLRYITSTAIAR